MFCFVKGPEIFRAFLLGYLVNCGKFVKVTATALRGWEIGNKIITLKQNKMEPIKNESTTENQSRKGGVIGLFLCYLGFCTLTQRKIGNNLPPYYRSCKRCGAEFTDNILEIYPTGKK